MTQLRSWRRDPINFWSSFGISAAWLIIFFVIPMGIVWLYSFGTTTSITEITITGTFGNYARVLDPLYLFIFGKSIALATLTTLLCLLVGFPLAWLMVFVNKKTRAVLLLAVMLPFWTNLLIRTYALIAVLRTEGYINTALSWFGIEPLSLIYNDFAVLVGLLYVHLPFAVLPLFAALDRMDRSLVEASLDLGASQLQTIRHVVLPVCAAGVLSAAFITFIPALGSFLTPDLLGGPEGQMIASVIERQFKRANDWPFGAALSLMLVYLTIVVVVMRNMFSKRTSEHEAT